MSRDDNQILIDQFDLLKGYINYLNISKKDKKKFKKKLSKFISIRKKNTDDQ